MHTACSAALQVWELPSDNSGTSHWWGRDRLLKTDSTSLRQWTFKHRGFSCIQGDFFFLKLGVLFPTMLGTFKDTKRSITESTKKAEQQISVTPDPATSSCFLVGGISVILQSNWSTECDYMQLLPIGETEIQHSSQGGNKFMKPKALTKSLDVFDLNRLWGKTFNIEGRYPAFFKLVTEGNKLFIEIFPTATTQQQEQSFKRQNLKWFRTR